MSSFDEDDDLSKMATDRKDYLATVALKLREEIYQEVADTMKYIKVEYTLYGAFIGLLIGLFFGILLTSITFLLWG